MPIYEYRCAKCGEFEQMQKMSEPALQRCPKCRRKVTKLISTTSFQLKGSGWYATDYAKKGSGTGTETKAADKSEASDTKSEKSEKKESSPKKDSSSSKASAAA